jgi:hypothetical protein
VTRADIHRSLDDDGAQLAVTRDALDRGAGGQRKQLEADVSKAGSGCHGQDLRALTWSEQQRAHM